MIIKGGKPYQTRRRPLIFFRSSSGICSIKIFSAGIADLYAAYKKRIARRIGMYILYDVAFCKTDITPDAHPASAPNPKKNSVSLVNPFMISTWCLL